MLARILFALAFWGCGYLFWSAGNHDGASWQEKALSWFFAIGFVLMGLRVLC